MDLMKERTIVSVSGYGATGASAVIDYLKGFDSVDVFDDFEFQIHYFPDGISDLDYALNESCSRFYDSDVAISRFLNLCRNLDRWYEPAFHGELYSMALEYIDSLHPVKWTGYWAYDRLNTPQKDIDAHYAANDRAAIKNRYRSFMNRFLRKLHLPQIRLKEYMQYSDFFESRPMYMSVKPDNFYTETRLFSERLIECASHSDAPIKVVNMLLPPQDPVKYHKYFNSPVKSIVVNRDPRDLYIHVKLPKWKVVPYEEVRSFIDWYKENMKSIRNDESVLRINFEDLIYENHEISKQLNDFLGIDELPNGKSTFNPHISVANTQHFKRFPQFENDIKVIERELDSFLYDFSSHETVESITNEIF